VKADLFLMRDDLCSIDLALREHLRILKEMKRQMKAKIVVRALEEQSTCWHPMADGSEYFGGLGRQLDHILTQEKCP